MVLIDIYLGQIKINKLVKYLKRELISGNNQVRNLSNFKFKEMKRAEKMNTKTFIGKIVFLILIIFWSGFEECASDKKQKIIEETADIIVYGATPGGVSAAIAAAREEYKVILIEPGRILGGLLGAGFRMVEDVPFKEVIGGLTLEFLEKDISMGGNPLDWFVIENQKFFEEMMEPYAKRIRVIYEYRVKEVNKSEGNIVSLLLENAPPDSNGVPAAKPIPGKLLKINGKVFIDASYEGDVMAKAGVTYRVGRESRDEYNESLAGVRGVHRFPGVSPYVKENDPKSGLLWMIDDAPLGEPGSANRFVNGYNFKFNWIKNPTPDNPGIIMPSPEKSDPQMDELLSRARKAGYHLSWPHYNDERNEICTGTIPGIQGDYPDGDWETRSHIWRTFIEHFKRLTAFSGEKVILHSIKNGEFGGWPPQLYLRATRRMVGRYVMTQADIALQTNIPDAVGLGFYAMDIHPTRLLVLEDGTLAHEGQSLILVSPGPFALPYRFITPRTVECTNLLVPVCFSASHFAHAAIRLEAQYMILGESAGVAAAQAISESKPVQDIDMGKLQTKLRNYNQKIDKDELPLFGRWRSCLMSNNFSYTISYHWQNHPEDYPVFLPEPRKDVPILVDTQDATKIGDWEETTKNFNRWNSVGYLYDKCDDGIVKSVVFNPILPFDGEYEIRIAFVSDKTRSEKVPIKINHMNGQSVVYLNQRIPPEVGKLFQPVGRYTFRKGRTSSITISNEGIDDGDIAVDAVQLVYIDNEVKEE